LYSLLIFEWMILDSLLNGDCRSLIAQSKITNRQSTTNHQSTIAQSQIY